MARDLSSWLPTLIGPLDLQGDGESVVPRRATLNFVGGTVTDNPELERTDIALDGGGGADGTARAVIFDGGTVAANLRGNRPTSQSPINNVKSGIVNLGSDSAGTTTGVRADFSTVGGGNQNAIGPSANSVIGGGYNNGIAVGESSSYGFNAIAGGSGNVISGIAGGVISGGITNSVTADGAIVLGGANNLAQGNYSLASGLEAYAYRRGQQAHASGKFVDRGDSQWSRYLVRGTSINGAAVVLSDEPGGADGKFVLFRYYAYAVRATCIAIRTDAPGRAMWINTLLAHAEPPLVVAVIDNDNPTLAVPNGQLWTIAYSVVGDHIEATFTGTVGHNVRAVVTFEWTEIGGGG